MLVIKVITASILNIVDVICMEFCGINIDWFLMVCFYQMIGWSKFANGVGMLSTTWMKTTLSTNHCTAMSLSKNDW